MAKQVYSDEFKRGAIEQVVVQRYAMSSVAKQLCVNYCALPLAELLSAPDHSVAVRPCICVVAELCAQDSAVAVLAGLAPVKLEECNRTR